MSAKRISSAPPKPAFEALDSQPSRWRSYAVGLIVTVFIAGWLTMTVGVVFLQFDHSEPLALRVALLVIVAVPYVAIPLARRFAKRRFAPHDSMRVDAAGLSWLRNGVCIRCLAWSALSRSPEDSTDLSVRNIGAYVNRARVSHNVLEAWVSNNGTVRAETISFSGGRLFHSHYRNEGALRARFVLGIRHFRPDLRIDPRVYSAFFIDQDDCHYQARDERRTNLIASIFVVLIMLGIYFFTEWWFQT